MEGALLIKGGQAERRGACMHVELSLDLPLQCTSACMRTGV